MSTFQPVSQYFATRSDTALYQAYEEYKIVECLSEETQSIDIFTHCKLQPHKLSIHAHKSSEFLLVLDSIR